MKKLTELFDQSQQFSVVYSKLKPGVMIMSDSGNLLKIVSIESKKRLEVAKIENLKFQKTELYSFPEIATLVNTGEWTIL